MRRLIFAIVEPGSTPEPGWSYANVNIHLPDVHPVFDQYVYAKLEDEDDNAERLGNRDETVAGEENAPVGQY